MRILIISRDKNYYATKRLIEESAKLNHQVLVVDPLDCNIAIKSKPPYLSASTNGKDLSKFDIIIPRIGIVGIDYALLLVKQFELMGKTLLNSHSSLTYAKNKFESLQILRRAGIPVPDTIMTHSPQQIPENIKKLGGAPAIIKLFRGSQGKGVIMGENTASVNSILTAIWALGLDAMLQKYLAETKGQDIRVFILGKDIIASMKRTPPKGEFRSNMHQGGTMKKVAISNKESELAIKSARILGLNNAGVDILRTKAGPVVLEVNSSPGFEGLEKITKINIAKKIIDYTIHLHLNSLK